MCEVCVQVYPEVIGELQSKDGDPFVVEGAGHRAGNVAWNDGDEAGRQQPRPLVPQLSRQQKGGDGGEAAEHRGQENTHVPDVDGDVQQVQHVVDEACGHHEAWVHLGGKKRWEQETKPADINLQCRN